MWAWQRLKRQTKAAGSFGVMRRANSIGEKASRAHREFGSISIAASYSGKASPECPIRRVSPLTLCANALAGRFERALSARSGAIFLSSATDADHPLITAVAKHQAFPMIASTLSGSSCSALSNSPLPAQYPSSTGSHKTLSSGAC